MVTSIGVDFWRSRQLKIVADRDGFVGAGYGCFSFASDIWSSVAVLAGLGASWLGARFGIALLRFADPAAAVVVSLMILRMTLRLGHEAVGVLLDEIPAETRRKIVSEVERVPGVLAVEQARVRRGGSQLLCRPDAGDAAAVSPSSTRELVRAATEAVHRALPEADVVIHTVPRRPGRRAIFDRVRAGGGAQQCERARTERAVAQGTAARGTACGIGRDAAAAEAHSFVSAMEAEILRETPEIDAGAVAYRERAGHDLSSPTKWTRKTARSSSRC